MNSKARRAPAQADCDLQPVGSPTGSAQNRHVRPRGGNGLGTGTLKPAQHLMGRPQTSLDAQKLLIEGPGGVGGDLLTIRPPRLAISLDSLCDRLRVAREEVCQDKKEASRKIRSQPDT